MRIMEIKAFLFEELDSQTQEKVIENNEKESGITIHFVNENFDEGMQIAQFHCKLENSETIESLQQKINKLELDYFPIVIEKVVNL